MIRAVAIAFVLAAAGPVALAEPPPELVLASHDDDVLTISKVADGKVTELHREPFTPLPDSRTHGAVAYAFSDRRTLWVLRADGESYSFDRIVDGIAAPVTKLALRQSDDIQPTALGLVSTASGQIWVKRCESLVPIGNSNYQKCVNSYRRLDDGSLAVAMKPPAGITFDLDTASLATPKRGKASTGYTIKLAKRRVKDGSFTGFSCESPSGKLEWPPNGQVAFDDFRFQPSANKVTWYATTPPSASIGADVVTPVREHIHIDVWLVGCSMVGSIGLLPGGLLLTGGELRAADGSVLGTIPGNGVAIAP